MNEKYSNILVEFYERMSSWENSIVANRDISLAQMHLLEVVGYNKKIRMKELALTVGVTTGTLTVMVHRLLSKDYIRKIIDRDDKRSYFIALTEKGQIEYDNHHNMHDHLIADIIHIIEPQECEVFFRNLKKIQEVM